MACGNGASRVHLPCGGLGGAGAADGCARTLKTSPWLTAAAIKPRPETNVLRCMTLPSRAGDLQGGIVRYYPVKNVTNAASSNYHDRPLLLDHPQRSQDDHVPRGNGVALPNPPREHRERR